MRLVALTTILAATPVLASCGSSDEPRATFGKGSETVLVHGIIEENGKPVQDAKVWLTLWPDDDDTPIGGIIDTKDYAPATTDDDGKYVLRLDPDELKSRYFNGDFLNFDISVSHEGRLGGWGSTVYLVDKRFWRHDEEDRIADDVHEIDFDLGKRPSVTLETLDAPDRHELTLTPAPGGTN